MPHTQKGSVLLYILIAVALMAAVTYAVTRDTGGQDVTKLSESQHKLYAGELIAHSTAANMAVKQITQWGVNYDELLFDGPTDAGYATNTGRQVYNPSGAGLAVFRAQDDYFDENGTTGWAWQGNVNVEWSSTTATDLIYSFINVATPICEQINLRLTGSTTIPTATVSFVDTFTETGNNDPFIASECADCEGVMSLCITDGTTNAYYNIIGSR